MKKKCIFNMYCGIAGTTGVCCGTCNKRNTGECVPCLYYNKNDHYCNAQAKPIPIEKLGNYSV